VLDVLSGERGLTGRGGTTGGLRASRWRVLDGVFGAAISRPSPPRVKFYGRGVRSASDVSPVQRATSRRT
jgi:hypothetical protein